MLDVLPPVGQFVITVMDDSLELGKGNHIADFTIPEFTHGGFIRVETCGHQDRTSIDLNIFGFLAEVYTAA